MPHEVGDQQPAALEGLEGWKASIGVVGPFGRTSGVKSSISTIGKDLDSP